MPTLSTFYGIVIQMFWQDHPPLHFHALYAEHEALIDIQTLNLIAGSLPRRAIALVRTASPRRSLSSEAQARQKVNLTLPI
jgi:hypothetical protein